MHRKRVKATRTHKIELGSRSAEVCPAGKSRFMGVRIEFTGPFRHSTPTRPFLSNCHLYPPIITKNADQKDLARARKATKCCKATLRYVGNSIFSVTRQEGTTQRVTNVG